MVFRARCLALVAALALVGGTMAACGGEDDPDNGSNSESNDDSNGSSSNDGDGEFEGDTIPDLSELTGDADNHDLLFFISTLEDDSGLFMVDPSAPEEPAINVDNSLSGVSLQTGRNFFPIHETNWDSDSRQISDFRVDRIFYFDVLFGEVGAKTISTDPSQSLPPEPKPVSNEEVLSLEAKAYFTYSLENADETAVVYSIDLEEWRQIRMGQDGDTAAALFEEGHVPVASSWAPEEARGDGWLIVDSNDENTLKMVDMDLELVDGAVTHDGEPIANIAANEAWSSGRLDAAVQRLGPMFGDGSQLLAIVIGSEEEDDEEDDEEGAIAELWYYQRGESGEPGTAYPLHNDSGETLSFEAGALSMGIPALPAAESIATTSDATFFLKSDGGMFSFEADLYRADAQGWVRLATVKEPENFIIADEDRVIYGSDSEVISIDHQGEDQIVIDPDDRRFGQDVETPVIGSRDGWIFYNRDHREMGSSTPFAVAAKVDGSESVQLKDARWIGSSTSGRSHFNNQVAASELGEVFMVRDESELAAVSAADPAAGMIRLGELPSDTGEVNIFGNAPGPHRLLQTESDESPRQYQIIYVNTRQQDSLVTVSPGAEEQPSMRPVNMF